MAIQDQTSLTKQDAINFLRERHDLSAEAARQIYEDLVGAMRNSIIRTGYLSIKDLGTFTVVKRAGRTVNHPASQKQVKIPARKSVRFALAQALKDEVLKKGKVPASAK